MSLTDGLRHFMDSCLGRGHPLSEHELFKLFQLRNVLLWWATQQIIQSLVTKSLSHMFSDLLLMLGGVEELSPINIKAHPH